MQKTLLTRRLPGICHFREKVVQKRSLMGVRGSQRVNKTPLFSSTTFRIALLVDLLDATLPLMRPTGDALEALYRSFRC